MRSARVTPNTVGYPSDYNALLNDAAGAASLLAHQMYGTIALPTNPTNGQTLTLDINGNNVVLTFVSAIGSAAGNVLIAGSAALTAANLIQLLLNPTISNANQVAIGANTAANVTLINFINWSLTGTNLIPSSFNSTLYAPATSFSASTTATGGSYTANTMALYVEPGVFYIAGTRVIFAGGATPTVTAPSGNPRIDVLSINASGTLSWTTGTENASPSAPTYPSPATSLPLCELYNVVGETTLYDDANQTSGQGYISTDARTFAQPSMKWSGFATDLIPDTDGSRSLGSNVIAWENVYAKYLFGNGGGITNVPSANLSANFTAGMSLSANVPVRAQQGTVTQQNNNGATFSGGTFVQGGTGTSQSAAFQFTAGFSGPFNSVSFFLKAVGTPTDNVSVNILTDSSNTPGSLLYSSSTIAGSTVSLSNYVRSTIGFANTYLLTSGTKYWVQVVRSGSRDTSNYYVAGSVSSSSGSFNYAVNNSGAWAVTTQSVNNDLEIQFADGSAGNVTLALADVAPDALVFGFTNAAISNGASGLVVMQGLMGGFSGLTIGVTYYLQNNGSIGTSAGSVSVIVGFAVSTTQLVVTLPNL